MNDIKQTLARFTHDDGQTFNFPTATDYHNTQRALDLAYCAASPFDRVWLDEMERRVREARPCAPNEYAFDADMIEQMENAYELAAGDGYELDN